MEQTALARAQTQTKVGTRARTRVAVARLHRKRSAPSCASIACPTAMM